MKSADHRRLAVARHDEGLAYAVFQRDGTILSRGAFPADAPARGTLIVSDYSLLTRPDVLAHAGAGSIGLLLPASAGSGDEPAEVIARRWCESAPTAHAFARAHELVELRRFLDERAALTNAMQTALGLVREHVRAISPDYFEILSVDGRLPAAALRLLHEHPTPRRLRAEGLVPLTRTLQRTFAVGGQQVVDRLFRFRQQDAEPVASVLDLELAERVIPHSIEVHRMLARQREAIDRDIHRLVSHASRAESTRPERRGFSLLDLAPLPATDVGLGRDPEALRARADALLARRTTAARAGRADHEEFKRIHAALAAEPGGQTPAETLRHEIAGQLLALSSRDFSSALRHRVRCEQWLSEHPTRADAPGLDGLRADAAIAMALTATFAIDVITGFTELRAAVEGGVAAEASPELRMEALGMLMLILAMFGEDGNYPTTLEDVQALIDELGGTGPARAGADIAALLLEGGQPDTPLSRVDELRATAEEHSRGTAYLDFFHYTSMLTGYVTKRIVQALADFDAIAHADVWPRFNPRFDRLSRLSQALHLAAKGELVTARRALAALPHGAQPMPDASDLICELFLLRLEIATGEHQHTLAQTGPDGPLGGDRIVGVHLRRFAPVSLILRGTALLREGATDLAHECFARGTQQAVMSGEWYSLLSGETLEYRAWLEALDPAALPAGLTPELRDGIIARPVFVGTSLPRLTARQRRVLELLAQGRSVNSISTELHVTRNTLKTHLRELYRRLGVHSRDQAVLRAEAYGLLDG